MAVKQLGKRASGPTDAVTFADLAALAPSFASTYSEMSVGTAGQGTSTQTAAASTFTRIALSPVYDPNGNWDGTNNWYTCPSAGVYEITAFLRPADSSPSGLNFGVGVYSSESDNPTFAWDTISTSNNGYRRTTANYVKRSRQAAGDQLRLFCYFDGTSTAITNASLQIARVE